MEFDLLYPEDEREMLDAPCIVAAVYFDREELIELGMDPGAMELDDAFIEDNEFEKAFKLWQSPLYLSDFFDMYRAFFATEYWDGVTEESFYRDVNRSIRLIKEELIDRMEKNAFPSLVEPLDLIDKEKRLFDSIRVKIKQGTVAGRYPFRFYAIEIEENKCYIITGATIKVHKDMGKAENTKLELKKLRRVYEDLERHGVKDREAFVNYVNGK